MKFSCNKECGLDILPLFKVAHEECLRLRRDENEANFSTFATYAKFTLFDIDMIPIKSGKFGDS